MVEPLTSLVEINGSPNGNPVKSEPSTPSNDKVCREDDRYSPFLLDKYDVDEGEETSAANPLSSNDTQSVSPVDLQDRYAVAEGNKSTKALLNTSALEPILECPTLESQGSDLQGSDSQGSDAVGDKEEGSIEFPLQSLSQQLASEPNQTVENNSEVVHTDHADGVDGGEKAKGRPRFAKEADQTSENMTKSPTSGSRVLHTFDEGDKKEPLIVGALHSDGGETTKLNAFPPLPTYEAEQTLENMPKDLFSGSQDFNADDEGDGVRLINVCSPGSDSDETTKLKTCALISAHEGDQTLENLPETLPSGSQDIQAFKERPLDSCATEYVSESGIIYGDTPENVTSISKRMHAVDVSGERVQGYSAPRSTLEDNVASFQARTSESTLEYVTMHEKILKAVTSGAEEIPAFDEGDKDSHGALNPCTPQLKLATSVANGNITEQVARSTQESLSACAPQSAPSYHTPESASFETHTMYSVDCMKENVREPINPDAPPSASKADLVFENNPEADTCTSQDKHPADEAEDFMQDLLDASFSQSVHDAQIVPGAVTSEPQDSPSVKNDDRNARVSLDADVSQSALAADMAYENFLNDTELDFSSECESDISDLEDLDFDVMAFEFLNFLDDKENISNKYAEKEKSRREIIKDPENIAQCHTKIPHDARPAVVTRPAKVEFGGILSPRNENIVTLMDSNINTTSESKSDNSSNGPRMPSVSGYSRISSLDNTKKSSKSQGQIADFHSADAPAKLYECISSSLGENVESASLQSAEVKEQEEDEEHDDNSTASSSVLAPGQAILYHDAYSVWRARGMMQPEDKRKTLKRVQQQENSAPQLLTPPRPQPKEEASFERVRSPEAERFARLLQRHKEKKKEETTESDVGSRFVSPKRTSFNQVRSPESEKFARLLQRHKETEKGSTTKSDIGSHNVWLKRRSFERICSPEAQNFARLLQRYNENNNESTAKSEVGSGFVSHKRASFENIRSPESERFAMLLQKHKEKEKGQATNANEGSLGVSPKKPSIGSPEAEKFAKLLQKHKDKEKGVPTKPDEETSSRDVSSKRFNLDSAAFSSLLNEWKSNSRDNGFEILPGGILSPLKGMSSPRTAARERGDDQTCTCQSALFSGNEDLVDFFLPKLCMGCTCGKKVKAFDKHRVFHSADPTSLDNILRPWQVAFLNSVGIQRGDQYVKVHHKSAGRLAKAMRMWRKKHDMIPVQTASCGMALHIWSRTCKVYIRSVRRQLRLGSEIVQPPNALEILSTFAKKVTLPSEKSLSRRMSSKRVIEADSHEEALVEV